MNTQAFVDELNMYSQLEFGENRWALDKNGKLSLIDENAEVEVTEVKFSQYTAELQEGETLQLTATVEPSDAANKEITWKSSSPEVASVSSTGLVTAIKEGTTTISATASNNVSVSCTVTVKKKALPVCEKPVITVIDGKLFVSSETSGSISHYTITSEDFKSGDTDEQGFVELSGQYNIQAYATAEGYQNSETVKAVLVWVNPSIEGDGIISMEAKKAVVIRSNGSYLQVCGTERGETIALYTLGGQLMTKVSADDGETTIPYALQNGEIYIVKYADKSIKYRF